MKLEEENDKAHRHQKNPTPNRPFPSLPLPSLLLTENTQTQYFLHLELDSTLDFIALSTNIFTTL